LQGEWTSKAPKGTTASGWNVIAVPGPSGFVLEVIPYEETLTFTPVVAAGNRGPFVDGVQQDQQLFGLMYEQIIHSVCDTDFCNERGFKRGTEIHAERGIFLNLPDNKLNSNLNIVRLSTIPHGNSVLALGRSVVGVPPNNNFIPQISSIPTDIHGNPLQKLGYTDPYLRPEFPGVFNQIDPNSFLTETLGTQKIVGMTTLELSTDNKDGGVLSIPFLVDNLQTLSLDSTFWIETISSSGAGIADFLQLQYTQTINLKFPPTGDPTPIIWPHITINTLRKV